MAPDLRGAITTLPPFRMRWRHFHDGVREKHFDRITSFYIPDMRGRIPRHCPAAHGGFRLLRPGIQALAALGYSRPDLDDPVEIPDPIPCEKDQALRPYDAGYGTASGVSSDPGAPFTEFRAAFQGSAVRAFLLGWNGPGGDALLGPARAQTWSHAFYRRIHCAGGLFHDSVADSARTTPCLARFRYAYPSLDSGNTRYHGATDMGEFILPMRWWLVQPIRGRP